MEKRIHIKDNLHLIMSVYKPQFQRGVLIQSAQLVKIEEKAPGLEVKSTIHGGSGDSMLAYNRVQCARATNKAIQAAFDQFVQSEPEYIALAKTRAESIDL